MEMFGQNRGNARILKKEEPTAQHNSTADVPDLYMEKRMKSLMEHLCRWGEQIGRLYNGIVIFE